jgi:hypothetical protein
MNKLFLCIAVLFAAPLAACQTIPSTAPSSYADQTKVDEQGAVTAELAYKSWRLAVETGVNAGLIKGQLASSVAGLDNRLYSALQAVEAAYAGGNAADINTAVASFNTALTTGYAAIGGK